MTFPVEGGRSGAATEPRGDLRQARADRQAGVMPSYVQRRDDGDELWAAFRRSVGNAWTAEKVASFVAGWDARVEVREVSPVVSDAEVELGAVALAEAQGFSFPRAWPEVREDWLRDARAVLEAARGADAGMTGREIRAELDTQDDNDVWRRKENVKRALTGRGVRLHDSVIEAIVEAACDPTLRGRS